ncbi:two-component system sensor histidine kinase CreC [Luteimonas sp. MC1895]|uniref:two-component system sensor histidine kinase CreC n=1 Tax=Luteimonas sp. MC1895 TaxID=2819513 RepID=UPI0018F0A19E|nr:two-component system sensor histidine kinase CreC [Luteimonas sp. MC1895]MBJ6978324.1 two-component system sensor histidine kinase CreC [Luteimonas sp. MC1895]
MRIGLRILLGYFVIVALAALLLGQVFLREVKPGVRQAMEDTLVDTANVLAELATDDFLAGRINEGAFASRVRALAGRDIGAGIWGFEKRESSYRITIADARGIVVFDSAGRELGADHSRWNDVHLTLRGRYGARSTRGDPDDDASSVMHVAAPIRDGARIVGALTVSKPNRAMAPFIARSEGVILRWGLVLLGTALLVGLSAAWWLSRQLGALRRYADAVTAGERASPPDAAGEFGDLGRALETMRERLEDRRYVERYVHTLTHELKSPLAAIRGSAELLESPLPEADRRRFASHIGTQSERMAGMIDKLLALAAVEHRQRLEHAAPVDLAAVAREVADAVMPRLRAAGVDLALDADEPLPSPDGDAFLLRQALENLVDNAIAFSPRGGTVAVALRVDAAGVRIEVADDGPGVPDFALEQVFARFYSLPRPGEGGRSSGIGLTFVAEVAQLHGGHAALHNRAGGGALASLVLPVG